MGAALRCRQQPLKPQGQDCEFHGKQEAWEWFRPSLRGGPQLRVIILADLILLFLKNKGFFLL